MGLFVSLSLKRALVSIRLFELVSIRPEATQPKPQPKPQPKGSVYFGDWAPDGKYIAYAMNPDIEFSDPKTRALWDIFVTRASGGSYVQVTFDHANNKQPEFFVPV